MWTESNNDWLRPELGAVNDSENKLGEMETYPGVLPDIINAIKKKGMRFNEVSLDNGDIRYLDNNIVVFRGDAAKLLNRAYHGSPSGIASQKIRQCDLRLGSRLSAKGGFSLKLVRCIRAAHNAFNIIFHKRSRPNEKS